VSAAGEPDRSGAAARVASLSGKGRVVTGGVRLIADFVVASRLVATGHPEAAVECLLPRREWPVRRVAVMVAVGALLIGVRTPRVPELGAGGRGGELTAQFLAAGTRMDCRALEALTAAQGDEVLVGVLRDLLIRFAALDWRASDHERALLAEVVVLAQRAPELSEDRLRAALVGLAAAAARLTGGDPR
jgi:hypothetical protein